MKRMKIIRKRLLSAVMAVALVLCSTGCTGESGKEEKDSISIYLWSAELMREYAPYIQSQLPNVDIEFVVGNNDLDFYKFLKENGKLPDIITNRRFSLKDAQSLKDQLMDLSGTEEAGSIYLSYLNNYTNKDGTVNWLPLCGEVDGFIANKALFDKYDIPMPTDYKSFVAACKTFEKKGIRGFVSDFDYDYTCMEILQGLSIPELTSMEGQDWRHNYEEPSDAKVGLDDKIWPGAFERMEQFIEDTRISAKDVTLSFDPVQELFEKQKVAIIRGTGSQIIDNASNEGIDPVFLPYFCKKGGEWLLTYPAFQVALNKELEKDGDRKKQALQVLSVMFSEKGQNLLAEKKDVIPYSKNVELEMSDDLANLKPYIKENHLYVRMASSEFFAVSRDVVQKMILGEYNAKQAYKAFDAQLKQSVSNKMETIVSFDKGYSNTFKNEGGNASASVMANTLRKQYGSDVLVAPAYSFTGSLMKADYTEKMVGYMIMPNALEAWRRDMTGAELKKYLKASVEGVEGSYAPFNKSSLPIVSGISLEVKEENGKFKLESVMADGKEIPDDTIYKVTGLNSKSFLEQLVPYLYSEEGIDAFGNDEVRVNETWLEYIKKGGGLVPPSDYITLN